MSAPASGARSSASNHFLEIFKSLGCLLTSQPASLDCLDDLFFASSYMASQSSPRASRYSSTTPLVTNAKRSDALSSSGPNCSVWVASLGFSNPPHFFMRFRGIVFIFAPEFRLQSSESVTNLFASNLASLEGFHDFS